MEAMVGLSEPPENLPPDFDLGCTGDQRLVELDGIGVLPDLEIRVAQ